MSQFRALAVGKLDRLLSLMFPAAVFGAALSFGGMVWWGRVFLSGSAFALGLAWFVRCGLAGRWPVLFSPLTALGTLAVGLGIAQLLPWPGALAATASPAARSAHALGTLPSFAREDDPAVEIPEPSTSRSPLTLDRSATLRWVVGASSCLALFWTASHFTNRLRRLSILWGSVVAAFVLNAAFVAVQLVGGSSGLYGFIEPGAGPRWAPNRADALEGPGRITLEPINVASDVPRKWIFPRPEPIFQLGTTPGGAEAFLAFGSLGLPLSLALALQLMAPRGSREPLWTRLSQSGRGSLLVLLYGSTVVSAFLIGTLAGRATALPFLAGIGLIGAPCLFGTGLRLKGAALTALTAGALGLGVWLGESWTTLFGTESTIPCAEASSIVAGLRASASILRDFPIVGVGLGAYPSAARYYRPGSMVDATAGGGLFRWGAETGLIGLGLLGLAAFWCVVRLPVAIARVGSADRALAFGFVGTLVCFGWHAAFRWSVELTAVAVAASVFAGTMNRWLAGGTDLLVEPADA